MAWSTFSPGAGQLGLSLMATLSPPHYGSHRINNRNTNNRNNTSTNRHHRPPNYRQPTHKQALYLTNKPERAPSTPTLPSSPLSSTTAGQLIPPEESHQNRYIHRLPLHPQGSITAHRRSTCTPYTYTTAEPADAPQAAAASAPPNKHNQTVNQRHTIRKANSCTQEIPADKRLPA